MGSPHRHERHCPPRCSVSGGRCPQRGRCPLGLLRMAIYLCHKRREGIATQVKASLYKPTSSTRSVIVVPLRGTYVPTPTYQNCLVCPEQGGARLGSWAKARKLAVFWTARGSPQAPGTAYWGRTYAGKKLCFFGLAYQRATW